MKSCTQADVIAFSPWQNKSQPKLANSAKQCFVTIHQGQVGKL